MTAAAFWALAIARALAFAEAAEHDGRTEDAAWWRAESERLAAET